MKREQLKLLMRKHLLLKELPRVRNLHLTKMRLQLMKLLQLRKLLQLKNQFPLYRKLLQLRKLPQLRKPLQWKKLSQ